MIEICVATLSRIVEVVVDSVPCGVASGVSTEFCVLRDGSYEVS